MSLQVSFGVNSIALVHSELTCLLAIYCCRHSLYSHWKIPFYTIFEVKDKEIFSGEESEQL